MKTPNIHVRAQLKRTHYAYLVAQAPGYVEERGRGGRSGFPLSGPSGWNFERYLQYLIPKRDRWSYCIDNVYDRRIINDNLHTLCQEEPATPITEHFAETLQVMGTRVPGGGGYLAPEGFHQLDRLYQNIRRMNPPIIIALGAFATFALTGKNLPLTQNRGVLMDSIIPKPNGGYYPLIPSYHPSPNNARNAPLLMFDLMKADNLTRGSLSWERENRFVKIPETKEDVAIELSKLFDAPEVSVDIETTIGRGFIKSVQFSPNEHEAIFIPLFHPQLGSYWKDVEDHKKVVMMITDLLQFYKVKKIFHNGPFDTQWLYEQWGCRTANYRYDTKCMAHSIFTELPRDLGNLGASFMNEIAWKSIGSETDEEKE